MSQLGGCLYPNFVILVHTLTSSPGTCSSLIRRFYCWKVTNFNTFLTLFSCLKESNHLHLSLDYELRPWSDSNQLPNLTCFFPHSFSYNRTCLHFVVKAPAFTHFRVLDTWTLCPWNACLPSSQACLPLCRSLTQRTPELPLLTDAHLTHISSSRGLPVFSQSWTKHVQGLSLFLE